jgi:hypothetical protein
MTSFPCHFFNDQRSPAITSPIYPFVARGTRNVARYHVVFPGGDGAKGYKFSKEQFSTT